MPYVMEESGLSKQAKKNDMTIQTGVAAAG